MLNDNENEMTNEKQVRIEIILTLILYCISGSLLTLLNKLAIVIFPFTNILLVLQNAFTVILLLMNYYLNFFSFQSIPSLNLSIIQIWIPVVILFVLMLMSSLYSLIYVSVSTVIVIRNLSTLFVALLEYVYLGRQLNILSIGTLIGMLLGAFLYAIHDFTFHILGYICLLINIFTTSIYQVYMKRIVNIPLIQNVGSIGMSFYNNLLSLPILFFIGYLMGEWKSLFIYTQTISMLNTKSILIVVLTCLFGFSLSISAFTLNKLISATSMMVANNVNKFLLIILSEIFLQSTLDMTSSLAGISVLFFACLYSQGKDKFAKLLFVIATCLFILLYIALELSETIIPIVNTNISPKFSFIESINGSLKSLFTFPINRINKNVTQSFS